MKSWATMKYLSIPMQRVLLAAFFLFIWEMASWRLHSFILPKPMLVMEAFLSLLLTPTFWQDVCDTVKRVLTGLVLSALVGTFLGVAFGSSRRLATFFEPVIAILNTISSAIWAVFAIIWFGISDASTITVVFMTAMPLILTNVWDATKTVDRQYVELARSFRMNMVQLIQKIYVPTVLPAFFSASRLAFGFGWRVSLVAETIGAGSGIGYRLRLAADMVQSAQVFAWTVLLIAFMMLFESGLIKPLEKWLFRWKLSQNIGEKT